jgi:hypothetical protein
MSKLNIHTPHGDRCVGCEFLQSKHIVNTSTYHEDADFCTVFGPRITCKLKCPACMLNEYESERYKH